MFKSITFNLSEPLCTCDEQNLTWCFDFNINTQPLVLSCKTCDAKLYLPYKILRAGFKFEKPYPGVEKKEETLKSRVGNLIPFRKKK